MEYQLIKPGLEHEEAYLAYLASWEATGEKLVPYRAGLWGKSYTEWLADNKRLETDPPAGLVPGTLFLFTDMHNNMLGFLDLRHQLNENLLRKGGHIGYGLHPAWRGKGLAPIMLELGLEKARALGLERVLVTCDRSNLPSARTILHCGGVLENELAEEDGNVVQRYWIAL